MCPAASLQGRLFLHYSACIWNTCVSELFQQLLISGSACPYASACHFEVLFWVSDGR